MKANVIGILLDVPRAARIESVCYNLDAAHAQLPRSDAVKRASQFVRIQRNLVRPNKRRDLPHGVHTRISAPAARYSSAFRSFDLLLFCCGGENDLYCLLKLTLNCLQPFLLLPAAEGSACIFDCQS